jgi:hypothetical protein
MYVCMYVCIYVFMYVCLCVCVCACVRMLSIGSYRGMRPPQIVADYPVQPLALPPSWACPDHLPVDRAQVVALVSAVAAVIPHDARPYHFLGMGAGALFDNGDVFAVAQSQCVEYSTTIPVDAKVACEIERRQALGVAATCFLLADHLGTIHAPCAVVRAKLSEHGWGALPVLVHASGIGQWCLLHLFFFFSSSASSVSVSWLLLSVVSTCSNRWVGWSTLSWICSMTPFLFVSLLPPAHHHFHHHACSPPSRPSIRSVVV